MFACYLQKPSQPVTSSLPSQDLLIQVHGRTDRLAPEANESCMVQCYYSPNRDHSLVRDPNKDWKMAGNESLEDDYAEHFKFGENWNAYSKTITPDRIREAERGLLRLLPEEDLVGHTLLDIGCGSGLHSLAALNLGVESVVAIDIDPDSVNTTRSTLERFASHNQFTCHEGNVFNLPQDASNQYDIVYSWGVLHHTGNMWKAIRSAAALVKPGGKLVIAIYLKTRFCNFWTSEKRFFTKSPKLVQMPIVWIYSALCFLRILSTGKNPIAHIAEYDRERGMSWYRDRIDWLGGYPYESATPEEIIDFVAEQGGKLEKSLNTRPSIGLLGTGCAEYVFRF